MIWAASKPIHEAPRVLNWLADQPNKKLFFVTNTTDITREDMAEKIRKYGFPRCTKDMIFTAAYTSAKYIKDTYPEVKKVHVVGMESNCRELADLGIKSCRVQD